MSQPKARDLRGLSADELNQKLDALAKELQGFRQKKITGQLDKPHFFKSTRRQIAQVHTVQREKKYADAKHKN